MKKRNVSSCILAFTLVLSIILSQFMFGGLSANANTEDSTETITVWNGNTAENFAGGDGTAALPYLIENAEQLRLLVTGYCSADYETSYFKLTKDIYLNNVVDGTRVKSLANKKNWAEDLDIGSKANSFYGTLDGDGHTVYGLYAYGDDAVLGLFPGINSATVIKNLNFDNLYINGSSSTGAAIAGAAFYYTWQKTAQISYCSVKNAIIGQSGNMEFAAGLVADTHEVKVNFTNCYVSGSAFSDWSGGAGFVANDWDGGATTYTGCYSAGAYPVSAAVNKATINNVYTNTAAPEGIVATGIVTLTDDQMKGAAAKANMAGFDFFGTWQTVENGYPVIRDEILPVWDGTKDYNLEGSGTEADPYLIKTAAHLAAIVTGNNSGAFTGKYFKLANDIRINDTTNANWKDSARNWVWADFRFVGTFDGDGHTIDGLYYNGSQRVMGLFSYVGADNNGVYQTTLKNFKMTNAYIESTAADGAGFAAGQASRVAYFDGIYIDDTCEINSTVTGAGGILGQSGYNVFMSNCAMNGTVVGGSNVGAFAGTLSSGARLDIKSSYTTADLYVQGVTDRNLADASGAVYALKKEGTVDSVVTILTAEQMKGENAKTYMTGFSFKYVWETVENDYPVYNPRGDLWDGTAVTDFTSFKGSGTAGDPYLIENGAQLAFAMVKNSKLNAGTCYKLANDIVLNDTSFEGWEASARPWPHQTANRWVGTLDGDGHTIEGLYMNTATKRPGLVSYSQGTFKNLVFSGASINYTGASEPGVAIIAAQTSGATTFENIYIDETCEINATAVKGVAALAGRGYDSTGNISITNCAVLATINTEGTECGALTGSQWVSGITVKISNCYSTSSKPLFGYATKALTADSGNNYSIVEDTHGTTVLTLDQMKGEAAKSNMSGLDFDLVWEITEGYPVLRKDIIAAWDGSVATTLGGEGTKANPYKISNGAELYYAISTYSNQAYDTLIESIPYFEITADINLANQQWYNVGTTSYPQSSNYTTGFAGIVYGNGHTVYNLKNSASVGLAGLIPVATQGTEIYDLHLQGGNLPKVVWNTYAGGGLIGLAVGTQYSTPIIISGCSVKNYTVGSRDASGAFVGDTYSQSLIIKDCYAVGNALSHTSTTATMNTGAFVGIVDGNGEGNSIIIENCYTDNEADIGYVKEMSTTFRNVYTTLDSYDNSVSGLTKLTAAEMTGAAAKTNMNGFNFNQIWQAVDGAYPVHTDMDYRAEYWDGNMADAFAGGSGTEAEPYLISNASELYLLANLDREATHGKFYKLTNNIAISNVYDGWANDDAYNWASQKAYLDGFTYSASFAGTLDGAGYTVSGIFYNDAITDGGSYAYGLIPFVTSDAIIKNLRVEDVTATVSGNAYVGAVAGAAHVTAEDAENPFKMVQFIAVDVARCDITAENAGDILGGATRGVKFELCNAAKHIGSGSEKIYTLNCNAGKPFNKDMIIYNSLNADSEAFALIRKVVLGTESVSIADINGVETVDILDLVCADKHIGAEEPEEVLVWSQEFGGDAMDYSVWSKNTTMGKGTTLNYADNYSFDGENMKMYTTYTGETDENGDKIYNVAYGLSTRDTMSFKYGRLEMRAKIPFGAGAFPSLWLTSRNAIGNGTVNEFDTEIDIFEVFGKTAGVDKLVTCIHKWYNDEEGVRTGDECSCGSGILAGNGYKVEEADRDYQITGAAQNEFHTFVFDWTEDTMTFSVDGNVYYTAKRSEMNNFDISGYDTNSDAVFNQYLYLRLNNHMYTTGDGAAYAYQGNAGEIDASVLGYEIDYIRLYQKENGEINLK